MKKKIMLLMLMLMLLAFANPSAVYAEDGNEIYPSALQDMPDYEVIDSDMPQGRAAFEDYDETQLFFELEERIKAGLLAGESKIDITDMRIDNNKYDLMTMRYYSPYFCSGIDVSFSVYTSGGYASINLKNTMTTDETKNHFGEIDRAVAEILGLIEDGMSEEEKALAIHDYFVNQFKYDYDNYNTGTIPDDSYRSGGLLKNRTGVCQAYAYGYKYIMNLMGMECFVTSSSQMNHAWNILKVDGAYYHVDCTWDDPVPDNLGRVKHTYFLLSDDIAKNVREHTGWNLEGKVICNSSKYDNAYWINVSSPIIIKEDGIYYIEHNDKGNFLYKKGRKDNSEVWKKDLGVWNPWNSSSYFLDAFSGLFLYEDEIYYNTSREIKKVSLDGLEENSVHKPDVSNGFVYGIRKNGDKIEYLIEAKESGKETVGTVHDVPIGLKQEVTGIVLNKKTLKLTEGETFVFEYVLAPAGIQSKVTWSSSDNAVALIDTTGKMTARKPGNITITATTDNGKKAACQVAVTSKPIQITGISLNKSELVLEAGKSETLTATISPSNATESKELKWETSNPNVAKVEGGVVTAVAAGEATITVTASNGMNKTCKVTVTGKSVSITNVVLDKNEVTLEEGGSVTLTATVEPADATESKELKWETSNAGVAKVENGVVTAVSAGEATVTATAGNGKSASCKVTVTKKTADTQLPFVDANDDWVIEAIDFVYKRGIMTGMDSSHFGPSLNLERSHFATSLWRIEGKPAVEYNAAAFTDVPDGQFYTSPVMWAKQTGVITGYVNGAFGPADDITREQIAVMMYRYAKYLGFDTSSVPGSLDGFPDAGKISDFAQKEVQWAVGMGLIRGDQGRINPQGSAERIQCAIIIQRFMEAYGL